MAAKVLFAGEVAGNFDVLLQRIHAVNTKAGPFAALLCSGTFFSNADADVDLIRQVTSGEKVLPFPVCFYADEGATSEEALLQLSTAAPACKLRYLGAQGIEEVAGLKVAFFDDASSTEASDFIQHMQSVDGDIDVLLTSHWPSGITNGVEREPGMPEGMQVIADIAKAARPRYHVASHPGLFYQRAPYMNPDLGVGGHATRFISLSSVNEDTSAPRWLHALALKPSSVMAPSELQAKPDGCTQSPYQFAGLGKKRKASDLGVGGRDTGREVAPTDASKSVFVKNLPFSADEDDVAAFFSRAGSVVAVRWGKGQDGKRRGFAHVQFDSAAGVTAALALSGQSLMGRDLYVDSVLDTHGAAEAKLNLGQAVKDCWFCLSNPEVDVHLVVDVSDDAYVAVDKGPIDDTHALVVSIEHYPNTLTLQPSALAEVSTMIASLRKAYESRGLHMVGFESAWLLPSKVYQLDGFVFADTAGHPDSCVLTLRRGAQGYTRRYLAFHSRGGNHCHLNFVGVKASAARTAEQTITDAAKAHGFALTRVDAAADASGTRDAVKALVGGGQYFQAFLPDGSRLVHPISRSERHPMFFGREVLAKLAGVPERSDWRLCKMASPAAEEEATAAFQEWFMPFSPNHG